MQSIDRRTFLGRTAMTLAAAEVAAPTRAEGTAAGAFGALKHIDAGVLSIAYADVGPASGQQKGA